MKNEHGNEVCDEEGQKASLDDTRRVYVKPQLIKHAPMVKLTGQVGSGATGAVFFG